MSTQEILNQIATLSPEERLFIVEKTFKDLLRLNTTQQLSIAAEGMEEEYRTNKQLTDLTTIDFEDFYEAK